jgi:energy-coupling factor transporter transmembrane protein EcfT
MLPHPSGHSPLHRWDARCKIFGLLIVTATLLQPKIPWLLFHSGLFIALITLSKLRWSSLLREFRIWGAFLFILFLAQALFAQGPRLWAWLPLSSDGLRLGLFTSWRIGLMLGYGFLFTAVTRSRELRDGLLWLMSPLPFLPARRISLMVSLALRFFYLLLYQAEEVRLAFRVRLGDRKRNPFRRVKSLGLPILRRSFLQAEEVTFALAARGFREDLPVRLRQLPLSHLIPLFFLLGFLLFMAWF